uniref:Uncharacterized protein n=1 Tax=Anguilla anguilla TaxID=7936 RepID=A0A0E9WZC3_ANGAN
MGCPDWLCSASVHLAPRSPVGPVHRSHFFLAIGSAESESLSESCSSASSLVAEPSWPTGIAPFLWGRTVKKASCQSLFSKYARMISKTWLTVSTLRLFILTKLPRGSCAWSIPSS